MIKIDVNNNNRYFGKFEIEDEQAFKKAVEAIDDEEARESKRVDGLFSALYCIVTLAIADGFSVEELGAALDYARTAIPISKVLVSVEKGETKPYIGVDLAPGDHFTYNGLEFICLDINEDSIFAIMAKCYDELPFNTESGDGCNNWAESSLRRVLNEDVLNEYFNVNHLIKQTTDLTADNGDKKYGTCEDYLTLLTCDQYRKYREFVPLFNECMWTVTPWRCDVSIADNVRNVNTSGALNSNNAYDTHGLAPACLFNRSNLKLRRQVHIELCEREGTDND